MWSKVPGEQLVEYGTRGVSFCTGWDAWETDVRRVLSVRWIIPFNSTSLLDSS
jgi:hypothetical protein